MGQQSKTKPGNLTLGVVEARGVKSLELLGQPDSYVVLKVGEQEFSTAVKQDDGDPQFNEEFTATAKLEESAMVEVLLMEKYADEDDEVAGKASVPLSDLASLPMERVWLELERNGNTVGEVCIYGKWEVEVKDTAGPEGDKQGSGEAEVEASEAEALKVEGKKEPLAATKDVVDMIVTQLEGPRPWFATTSWYYSAGKGLYRRVKQLPIASFVVPLYERGVDGVLVRTIAKPTGEQGVGGLAKIDESLTSRLSAVDSAVDSLKDTVLHKAQKIKNNVLEEVGAVPVPSDEVEKPQGRVWPYVKVAADTAKPVAALVPLVGKTLVRGLNKVTTVSTKPAPALAPEVASN